ncbi:MAG: hypothetical protein HOV92_18000 [Streptomyces sp.]|nr:hypothetical protein [Streptomyces sp.]
MNPLQAPTPFNLDTAQTDISNALIGFLRISLDADKVKNDPDAGRQIFESIKDSITAGLAACGEVKRLLDGVAALRDRHQPRPHADPTQPGALCSTCSLNGAIVAWPCDTWTGVDRLLTHGKH